MDSSWVSVIPFLVVIPVAIWTKQVLPGLTLGLLVGSYLMEPSFFGGIQKMMAYVVKSLSEENKLKIIIFLYVFSGLIGMIKMAGGIKGFVNIFSKKIKTKKGVLSLIWISTVGTFITPQFRIVTLAPIMKSIVQRVGISKQRLGVVLETTSAPIIVLIPIATAFIGYMNSVIQLSLDNQGINQDSYSLFIQSIPFNFFSIVIILYGVYRGFFQEAKEKKKQPSSSIAEKIEPEDWEDVHPFVAKDLPSKPFNLLIPLILVLVLTFFITWWDGQKEATTLFDAFMKADVMGSMVMALLITFLFTFILFLFQKMSVKKLINHFVSGGNDLMKVILLLAVVWGLSAVAEDLGFSTFVTSNTGWIPNFFVPPTLFLIGAFISYFIGSSWGTWGILMPLGISLAQVSNTSLPIIIGAVFASGTFGAFASPLSDVTVMTAKILGMAGVEYARYKLKPALIAAGIATVLYSAATLIF